MKNELQPVLTLKSLFIDEDGYFCIRVQTADGQHLQMVNKIIDVSQIQCKIQSQRQLPDVLSTVPFLVNNPFETTIDLSNILTKDQLTFHLVSKDSIEGEYHWPE